MAKRVFVLEDDRGIREVLELILAEEGYEMTGFSSIADFVRRDHHQMADLFLLDVMLPDGNGIDVCETLKLNSATNHIPVLMMSANANKREIEARCGTGCFVSKPFDIYNFIGKISSAIDN